MMIKKKLTSAMITASAVTGAVTLRAEENQSNKQEAVTKAKEDIIEKIISYCENSNIQKLIFNIDIEILECYGLYIDDVLICLEHDDTDPSEHEKTYITYKKGDKYGNVIL